MKKFQIDVTDKESEAITEYAAMCGEQVSTIIRKIVMQEIALLKNRGVSETSFYDYDMLMPSNTSVTDEERIIEDNYNKIRKIMGWPRIILR